jgi:hypothetical protein
MSGDISANDPSVNNVPAVPPAAAEVPAPAAVPADPALSLPPEPARVLPPENVVRGLLLALIALPAGVLVFTLIWNLGFISAIVGFGVAFAAFFLYRLGSGGRVSLQGALVVTLVTVGTLIAAFIFANVSDIATVYAQESGLSWFEVLSSPGFLPLAFELIFSPEGLAAIGGNAAITLLFGVLGCFTVLRGAFKEARAAAAPPTL